LTRVCEEPPGSGLSEARGSAATFGTGVKLLDESAEARIGLPNILRLGSVHKLVAVVIHLDPATRASHFVCPGHSSPPCLRRSVDRYSRATVAQRLRHPDEFFQKLIDAPNVGLIEKSSILGKHFLNAGEIDIPENRNQPQFTHNRQQVLNYSGSTKRPG